MTRHRKDRIKRQHRHELEDEEAADRARQARLGTPGLPLRDTTPGTEDEDDDPAVERR